MNKSKLIYPNHCIIHFIGQKIARIELAAEVIPFEEAGKPVFNNHLGETVMEFTGLASDGNPYRSLAQAQYAPHGYSLLHYHQTHTEDYYIIEGQAEVSLNGVLHPLSAGEQITIPAGTHHQVRNITRHQGILMLVVKCEPAWTVEDLHFI